MSTHNANNSTPNDDHAANLTAHALNQLHGDDLAALKTHLAQNPNDDTDRDIRETQSLAAALTLARSSEDFPTPSPDLRNRLEQHLTVGWAPPTTANSATSPAAIKPLKPQPRPRRLAIALWAVAASLLIGILLLPAVHSYREAARRAQSSNELRNLSLSFQNYHDTFQSMPGEIRRVEVATESKGLADLQSADSPTTYALSVDPENRNAPATEAEKLTQLRITNSLADAAPAAPARATPADPYSRTGGGGYGTAIGPAMPGGSSLDDAAIRAGRQKANTQTAGRGFGRRLSREDTLQETLDEKELSLKQNSSNLGGRMMSRNDKLPEIQFKGAQLADNLSAAEPWEDLTARRSKYRAVDLGKEGPGTEQYDPIIENPFLSPLKNPLSTFSIDVDTASYANVRRFLTTGRLPPPNSVRIEELVNYFRYDYPQPKTSDPFSVNMEVAECPWREGHLLLRVGLKGKEVNRTERPQSNLVFLLDVSGSMADENKLPLLKTAMQMLVRELGENDRVSIVTYAGEAGLRLPPTRGHEQQKIHATIESLQSGGSTNGSAGINLAYEQAAAYFVPGGTNRVILCTDGDLNVGITSDDALIQLIKQKATGGTFLTVLGFGEGNLKDAKMEKLADNGNGLYAYIDSVREARKVLVEQLTGSTITIAKDVKIQIEFNPQQIAAYRLLGYENRLLAAQDFNNDKKDAGEIGAGHTVTALYELVPAGAKTVAEPARPGVDPLKYQQPGANLLPENRQSRADKEGPGPGLVPANRDELLTLKLRYKQPDSDTSQLLEHPLADRGASFNSASPDFQFAAAVASFGMILRGSEHRGTSTLAAVAETASASLGPDPSGYRAEFLDLIRKTQALQGK